MASMSTRRARTSSATSLPRELRIIGGRWRGTKLRFPAVAAIRPTPDRVRETLFNWLAPVVAGSRCLDLFAGSGALGLEALSRGARETVFVEQDSEVTRYLRETLQRLNAPESKVVTMDARRFLEQASGAFDIVFLDPPFGTGLLRGLCAALDARHLAADAWIYIESEAEAGEPRMPPGWSLHRSKYAGKVGYHLARKLARGVPA